MNSFLGVLGLTAGSPSGGPWLAYVDPGAGSFLLQVLLGGLAGAAVVARIYWKKLRGWFRRDNSPAHDARPQKQD